LVHFFGRKEGGKNITRDISINIKTILLQHTTTEERERERERERGVIIGKREKKTTTTNACVAALLLCCFLKKRSERRDVFFCGQYFSIPTVT